MLNSEVPSKVLAYVGAIASDLHNGAFDPKRWYEELEKGFLDYLESLIVLDFVVITGDFFDTKISMNSDHATYALKFLTKLLKICEKKNAKCRIIKGTESHDNKQLEIFKVLYRSTKCDFKVIQTVEDEWLFDDLHVLYIPEEYMSDMNEYYKEYFAKTYDMIFGHGMINQVLHIATNQESEVTMSKAPIFKTNELFAICKGPIFFGHIHKDIVIDNKFYYVNSFSRWSFGEEEDKGFRMCFYSPVTGKYRVEYIVNKLARRFDTITVDCGSPDFNKTEKEQIEYLMKLVDTFIIDYLRLEINIPEDYPNPNLFTKMLNEVFSKFKNIKLKINNNSKLRQKKEIEEKVNILLEKYGFIFNKSISYEEKLSRFIKEKYGRNIPVDKIRQYLFEGISAKGEN